MKKRFRLRRILFLLPITLVAMTAAPAPSRAGSLDKFADLVDAVPGVFPVSGSDIRQSEAFFQDLANANSDVEVLEAFDDHKDAAIFKSVTGDIPTGIWHAIYAYIAFRDNDAFGVLEHMGKAGICLIAQYLATGGVIDVCDVLAELIELAEEALDAAMQLAEFAASIGEGFLDAGEAIVCAFGGCDDSPPPPPEYYAYTYLFAPKVPAGVKEIEKSDAAFNSYLGQLKATAGSKPTSAMYPLTVLYPNGFGEGVVSNVSKMFIDAVHKGWSADMKNVLPALTSARNGYGTQQKIADLAQKAASKATNESSPVAFYAKELCEVEFRTTLGFEHVDRWIIDPAHQQAVADLKPITNSKWCEGPFWSGSGNREKFAAQFGGFVQANFCPQSGGQKYSCPNLDTYRKCLGILGSVDREGECAVNMTAAGFEAAKKIQEHFTKQGSEIPCEIVKKMSKPGSPSVAFVCGRPIQHIKCESTYKSFFGGLPAKLMSCVLDEDPKYKELKEAVKKAAGTLVAEYGGDFYVWSAADPLAVYAPSKEAWEKVQKGAKQDFGFGPPSATPGFQYVFNPAILFDGLSTPVLAWGVDVSKMTTSPAIQSAKMGMDLIKPGDPDPFGKTSAGPGKLSASGGQVVTATSGAVFVPKGPELGGAPVPKTTQGKLPGSGSATASAGGSVAVSKALPGTSQGSAPPAPRGAGAPAPAPGGRLALQGIARTAAASPDIKSGPRVLVAGKHPVAWGQGVVIPEAEARRAHSGICDVALGHDAINAGSAASGPFARRWANQEFRQNPAPFTDTYPSIPAGGSLLRTDTLPLKPGVNRLTLALDPMNQVKETNESDNLYTLTITVNGTCGLIPPPPSSAPGRGVQSAPSPAAGTGARTAPATRLPAVQQPQVPPNRVQPRVNVPRQ